MRKCSVILIPVLMMCFVMISTGSQAAEIYRWVDKNGTVFFSDTPPPYGNFKKHDVEDDTDQLIDKKKEVERQPDTSEKDKLDQKIKIEYDYQKKVMDNRNYRRMRDELEYLDERCQKKRDELTRQLDRHGPRSSLRGDIYRELEQVRRDCEKEAKQIRNLYGYY